QSSDPRQSKNQQEYLDNELINEILGKIRDRLAARGVRGICSIGKNFRIIDDNNSQTLDFEEFKKAARDFRFGWTDEEVHYAFAAFDRKNTGHIDYDEFLRTIRGNMNDFRRRLVEQAFNILDKSKNGVVDIEDIKDKYNARQHPDVKSGKRTEDEILLEFIETFESTYNYLNGGQADGQVTWEEFMEYYEDVSMSIDDDSYFEVMMNNAWRMNSNTTYNNEKKGWNNKSEQPQEPKVSESYQKKFGNREESNQKGGSGFRSSGNQILDKFRKIIHDRGGRGIIGLARQFKIFDDNGNKHLDCDEFTKAIKDYKVDLNPTEIKALFGIFDRDGSGTVDYDEFLRQVRGEMNETRKAVVLQAFDKWDWDRSGVVELNEVKALYNAKNNKDVLAGRKTEEDVYGEFIETFETHHNINKGVRDRRVTKEEFIEYYNNISMSVDDDNYFVEIIKNAWKLGGQPDYTKNKAWASDYDQNKQKKHGRTLGERNAKVGTSANAPFGTDNEPTSYATSNNPKKSGGAMVFSSKGEDVILKFRKVMAARGTRGIMSIRRAFMIADDDGSKTIDINEFKKFCHDYRIDISSEEEKKWFNIFDRDNNGHIDYDEFIYGIVGEMNDFRQQIVKRVFNKFDKNGNGIIETDDLRDVYSAKSHPDVLSGKKCEEEVLAEFLDNFEYHFSLLNMNKTKDRRITLEEFMEYYNNISMSIPDDQYFEVMMTNAWNLDNKPRYGKGFKAEY
ncbi:MAG: EF-hand domain-containing protein, partial [Mycoplasma sp.]